MTEKAAKNNTLLKNVKSMTNWNWLAWGKVRSLCFLTLCMVQSSLSLSTETAGGPTVQPERVVRGENSSLYEVSPVVLEVEVKKGDPFLEVFIKGSGDIGCNDKREYQVQREIVETIIVPRLERSRPEAPCKPRIEEFRDKVADLDPNSEASNLIKVLGYNGWIEIQR
jgi:hypothetical protein